MSKKVLFSGMQATGSLTLGNYLGALANWIDLSLEYESYYCVVDLHSITINQDRNIFASKALNLMKLYIAAGLDPKKSCLYFQSQVPAHSQLAWVLSCSTYMGELNRMTQFKDKATKAGKNINVGLYTYPVLMAADILLFQTNIVPVGTDQKQHIEITRDIAIRFNNSYNEEIFTIPEPYFGKSASRIMSLQDPYKKMSKSDDNKNASIHLTDDRDTIIKKFKKAVTDSLGEVKYDIENQPGVSNLIEIYAACKKISIDDAVKEFAGRGYGDFKTAVGEVVADTLTPLQKKLEDLNNSEEELRRIIVENGKKASDVASATMNKVYKTMGFPLF